MTLKSTPLSPQNNNNTIENQSGRLSEDQRHCEDICMKTEEEEEGKEGIKQAQPQERECCLILRVTRVR